MNIERSPCAASISYQITRDGDYVNLVGLDGDTDAAGWYWPSTA
jgi:hypothetical protein